MSMVRTRIAPSPTGFPHIGTIYQALFDYAFAKKHNGQFIVRIEDTDQSRFVEGAEDVIFSSFDWFGLHEDESPRKEGKVGPYRQSERLAIYKEYAQKLVDNKHAYYCFCTKERLEETRKNMQSEGKIPMYDKHCRTLGESEIQKKLQECIPYTIRMAIPADTKITCRDEIRGEIVFDSNTIDDQVILKGDGFPTYHLAVVVDDHLMEITHVVRGEEWISSMPKHVLLYDFFGWEKPLFFHTPVLRNPDKSKLSKRHGHTSVSWYREQGYLPEAILNYLALMGWSHPEGKEIFALTEFVSLFDLKELKPVGPIFDIKKLEWMSGEYIRNMSDDNVFNRIDAFIDSSYDRTMVKRSVPFVKERIKKLSDYIPLTEFLFKAPTQYEVDLTGKKEIIALAHDVLKDVTEWKAAVIGDGLQKSATEKGIKFGDFFMVLRVAISGKKITPPLNESIEMLGKEETVRRLSILL